MKKPFASDMKFSALLLALAAAATFTAAPAQTVQTAQTEKNPPVRILFLCDLHVSPENEAAERLREAVAQINRTAADAVIVAGDLTNEGSDEELRCVKSILDLIELPTYVIPGNHEDNWSQSACRTFDTLWGRDRFAFEVRGTLFAGINCGPYMKMGDGHVKHEDLAWLDSLLMSNKGKRVVSVNHYPLTEDIDDWEDYADVLLRHRTAVHLCGHYHTFRRYSTDGIDGLMNRSLNMPSEQYGDEGYTLIELTADSLRQWNIPLEGEAALVEAFAIDDSIKPAVERADTAWQQPEGYRIELLHRDEASIFTRLGIDRRRPTARSSRAPHRPERASSYPHRTDVWYLFRRAADAYAPQHAAAAPMLPTALSATGFYIKEDTALSKPWIHAPRRQYGDLTVSETTVRPHRR